MFLQPGINVPQLKQAAEGIKLGTVMDPFKFPDPKHHGRVKTRVMELHGPGSAGMIPDSDIPWSQNERENSFGSQSEMSTFGLPQKNSMMKARHHGDSKYSPIVSGAPYSGKMSKISEWSPQGGSGGGSGGGSTPTATDGNTAGGGGSGGSGDSSGFNQKDHYGHKDPLGNLFHVDMKTKTCTIDFSKLSEVNITMPKTKFKHVDTKHDRTKGWGESGGPSQIQGQGGGSGGGGSSGAALFSSGGGGGTDEQPPEGKDTVKGDVTWEVDGQHDKNIKGSKSVTTGGDVSHDFGGGHSEKVAKDVTQTYSGKMTRSVSQEMSMTGNKGRTDEIKQKPWNAASLPATWAWCKSPDVG
jgi:hypothetical protein